MKPLIAIDDWKLPVFRKGLEEAGFTFSVGPGLSLDTLFISMEIPIEQLKKLTAVVKQCQLKAAELKN